MPIKLKIKRFFDLNDVNQTDNAIMAFSKKCRLFNHEKFQKNELKSHTHTCIYIYSFR